jgi:ankyrin repeat protein
VVVLLDKAGDRVDVNLANKDGKTPLLTACWQGKAECVAMLLDKAGDRVDVNLADKYGATPLFAACYEDQAECVAMLLDKASDRLDVNRTLPSDSTVPLHWLGRHNAADHAMRLLALGADCNVLAAHGQVSDAWVCWFSLTLAFFPPFSPFFVVGPHAG